MRYTAWEELWWNNITGPRTVVERVARALLESRMVVLKVPSDLPWRYPMRSAIQAAFNDHVETRDVIVEAIDAVDNNPDDLEPGRLILNNYASSSIRAGYREKARISIQDYISDRNVLKNRIIWVKGLEEKAAEKWIRFCRGFSPRSVVDGLFVLEIHGKICAPESRVIQFIDFDECVSNYDVQQFNSFVLDGMSVYSGDWKRYISTAAAMVCGNDAEISEMLLRLVDFKSETPIDGLRYVEATGDFSRRGTEDNSGHPLWHFRNNNFAELQHRLWVGQIQTLFPKIELERQRLIAKWYSEIDNALSQNSVQQFGVTLTDPTDVELGTLSFMMSCKVAGDLRMLYIPEDRDRDRIHFLHDCRNKLAHMECCTPGEIGGLLDV